MLDNPQTQTIQAIGRVVSPYREKFGIPRQPGLVPAAQGYIQMLPTFSDPAAFTGIEGFSHVWITFGFHACAGKSHLRVRPPRLGGNQTVGVFASRSPFRPNHLGLSVVAFLGIAQGEDGLRVQLGGLDILHDSPVYDIKPYLPYADSIAGAQGGFADTPPIAKLQVTFSAQAEAALQGQPALRALIVQTLQWDPRPAYRQTAVDGQPYAMRLQACDVRWQVEDQTARVQELCFTPPVKA